MLCGYRNLCCFRFCDPSIVLNLGKYFFCIRILINSIHKLSFAQSQRQSARLFVRRSKLRRTSKRLSALTLDKNPHFWTGNTYRCSSLENAFYERALLIECILLPLFQCIQYLVGGHRDRFSGAEYPSSTHII